MATASKPVHQVINYPVEPKVKYVKKANMWVKTYFEKDNKGTWHQRQEWSVTKP